MNNQPVAVLDSGVGGLPYLAWIKAHLPQERLVYVADRKNFPYGEKSAAQVTQAVLETTQALQERCQPKLLAVACNTASVVALDALRQTFSFPIVGVVPAVKTAAQVTRNGRIGVLATRQTANSTYLTQLITEHCPGKAVFRYSASDLVDLVEADFRPESPEKTRILTRWARQLQEAEVDTVVLACTHFLHVEEDLKKLLPPNFQLVDSRDGVGRRTKDLLSSQGLMAEPPAPGHSAHDPDLFYFTASAHWSAELKQELEAKYAYFAQRFGLQLGGAWIL